MAVLMDQIAKTPNPKCPACNNERLHTKVEWKKYHPKAGHGVDNRDMKSIKKSTI